MIMFTITQKSQNADLLKLLKSKNCLRQKSQNCLPKSACGSIDRASACGAEDLDFDH